MEAAQKTLDECLSYVRIRSSDDPGWVAHPARACVLAVWTGILVQGMSEIMAEIEKATESKVPE
jgi:hypothetical protein